MKTLLTLLMISLGAPTVFAQVNCERVKSEKAKLEKIKKEITEKNQVIQILLTSIKNKKYHVTGSKVAIGLGSTVAIVGAASNFLSKFDPVPTRGGAQVAVAGVIIAGAAGYYLKIKLDDLETLNDALEIRQSELAEQERALLIAETTVNNFLTMNPACN